MWCTSRHRVLCVRRFRCSAARSSSPRNCGSSHYLGSVALRIISGLWLFAGQLTHFSPRKPAYSPAAQVSEHLNFAQLKVAFRCDPHCASRSDTRRCRPVSPDAFAML
eukprot:3070398-Rhodomonas_salina.1